MRDWATANTVAVMNTPLLLELEGERDRWMDGWDGWMDREIDSEMRGM